MLLATGFGEGGTRLATDTGDVDAAVEGEAILMATGDGGRGHGEEAILLATGTGDLDTMARRRGNAAGHWCR